MPRFNLDDYIDCQQRINRFWDEYPSGRIETDLMSLPDDFSQCRYRARIYKEGEPGRLPDATGWAFELAGGAGANSTSHEENCETSAIGRALANMGYAKTGADRPSRQEMQKANQGHITPSVSQTPRTRPESTPQPASRPAAGLGQATEKQINYLRSLAREHTPDKDVDPNDFLHGQIRVRFGLEHLHDLNKAQASEMVERFSRQDFVDAVKPATIERVDSVEAQQQGLIPSVPAWVDQAPDPDFWTR